MIDYSALYDELDASAMDSGVAQLRERIGLQLDPARHGDMPRWLAALASLPQVAAQSVVLDADAVSVAAAGLGATVSSEIEACLREFHPWRKGPYNLHGVYIDTEWRSDKKWNRLVGQLAPLAGRRVLDVGCGNGYHCWRMAGMGAQLVVGIDPTLLYVMQYHAVAKLLGPHPVYVVPLTLEQLPESLNRFYTVFSLGVLYHRRSPIDHLLRLRECLASGGELILETLVIEAQDQSLLVPRQRYAKMRNVWFIPSVDALTIWLERCGFHSIRVIDVSKTTTAEQRSTDWMRFDSLASFLSPQDDNLTVEGLPAPRRAILSAQVD